MSAGMSTAATEPAPEMVVYYIVQIFDKVCIVRPDSSVKDRKTIKAELEAIVADAPGCHIAWQFTMEGCGFILGVSTTATNPLAEFVDAKPKDSDVILTKLSKPVPRGTFEAAKKAEADSYPFMPEHENSD